MEHAAYAKPDYKATKKNLSPSTTPRHDDSLTRHRQKEPLVFTPTHRLAKEMRARGAKAQTYHSFFRWSGQTEWTPERIGQKYIPRVIIWDEVCTVHRPILETFFDWLDGRGVQVVSCGEQSQPPLITGEMPHDWLQWRANYYEEVLADHRAKEPALKALKREIRHQPD
ncbi:MAG: AAA family ATPase [Candidatus Thiodiazotropha sp.]